LGFASVRAVGAAASMERGKTGLDFDLRASAQLERPHVRAVGAAVSIERGKTGLDFDLRASAQLERPPEGITVPFLPLVQGTVGHHGWWP
jgi:hypothetical protein